MVSPNYWARWQQHGKFNKYQIFVPTINLIVRARFSVGLRPRKRWREPILQGLEWALMQQMVVRKNVLTCCGWSLRCSSMRVWLFLGWHNHTESLMLPRAAAWVRKTCAGGKCGLKQPAICFRKKMSREFPTVWLALHQDEPERSQSRKIPYVDSGPVVWTSQAKLYWIAHASSTCTKWC